MSRLVGSYLLRITELIFYNFGKMLYAFFIVLIILGSTVACCPCREVGVTETVFFADSTKIVHIDTMSVVERDTIYLQRLEQNHDRVQGVTSSHLENDYCTSSAWMGDDGKLNHTLDTRDSALLPARIIYRDRVLLNEFTWSSRVNVSRVKTREVAKSKWYDKVIHRVCIGLAIIVILQNRKRIMRLVKLWRI